MCDAAFDHLLIYCSVHDVVTKVFTLILVNLVVLMLTLTMMILMMLLLLSIHADRQGVDISFAVFHYVCVFVCLFVCLSVRLQISPPRIKLAASKAGNLPFL